MSHEYTNGPVSARGYSFIRYPNSWTANDHKTWGKPTKSITGCMKRKATLQEIQAQGLPPEEAVPALMQRFLAAAGR